MHRPRLRSIVFALLLVALFIGTTMPGDLKQGIESQMRRGIPWSTLAHFTLFALIAMCPVYGQGQRARWRALGLAVALATLTEVLQIWVPGRHALVRDALIDLSGTVTGLAASALITTRWFSAARA